MNETLYIAIIIALSVLLVLDFIAGWRIANDRNEIRDENKRLLEKVLHLEYFIKHLGNCDVGKVKELYKEGTTTIPYTLPFELPTPKEAIEIHIIQFRKRMSISIK
ncbi:MAG: hypothetical protein NTU73_09945 [Ignavibacteriae bacterium]|nr:hypothetical protein [Ignavibacteriota bacterium]